MILPTQVGGQRGALPHSVDSGLWPRVLCARRHVAHRKDILGAALRSQALIDRYEPAIICASTHREISTS